jgi:phosphatidate cytidylyltransferase
MLLLGALVFRKLNTRSTAEKSRERNLKLLSYALIVFVIMFSIGFVPWLLYIISSLLIFIAIMELVRVSRQAGKNPWPALILASAVFYLFAGFIRNSNPEIILFVYFIVINFDGFSQVTGESFGKNKLVPVISPGKTIEGLAGGIGVALILGMLMLPFFKAYNTWYELLLFTLIIIIGAVTGDLLASAYKRFTGIKDYSNLIPGHGGVLDRFDSFFMAGAVVELLKITINK